MHPLKAARSSREPLTPRDWDPRTGWLFGTSALTLLALFAGVNLITTGNAGYVLTGIVVLVLGLVGLGIVVVHLRRPVADPDSAFLPPAGSPADKTFRLDRARDAYLVTEVDGFVKAPVSRTAAEVRAASFERAGLRGAGYDSMQVERFMAAWAARLDEIEGSAT